MESLATNVAMEQCSVEQVHVVFVSGDFVAYTEGCICVHTSMQVMQHTFHLFVTNQLINSWWYMLEKN